jgi:hypothetical protein
MLRIESDTKLEDVRFKDGTLHAYAFPGGYPLIYLDGECGVLCPECANRVESEGIDHWDVDHLPRFYDVNWEDAECYCDQCGQRIEPAYEED